MTSGYLAECSAKELLGASHLNHKSVSHDGVVVRAQRTIGCAEGLT